MSKQIWFITYEGLPKLDPDDVLAVEILRSRGYECSAKIWDDPTVDWNADFDLAIVRNTWDYHRKFGAFEEWLMQPCLENRIWNPPELMRWNLRKTYLRELEAAGVDIVPTVWIDQETPLETLQSVIEVAPPEAVLKPVIGLATSGVSRLNLANRDESLEKISALLKKHDAMLQPFMPEVATTGERALMFMNGKFSHAIRKTAFQAMAPAGGAGEGHIEPEADELAAAKNALSKLPHQWLYARVDVVRDAEHNKPRVMELELTEPSLFLSFDSEAPRRFADAIESKIAP